jgi:hypothetical protein
VILAAAFAAFAGCTDSNGPLSPGAAPNASSDGGGGAGSTGATWSGGGAGTTAGVGTKVWTSDATKVVADVYFGGYGGQYGGCPIVSSYTLTVPDRTLAWSFCTGSAPLPDGSVPDGSVTDGERIISTKELDGVISALKAVTVSSATDCSGFDGSDSTLTITNSAGTRTYWDDTYACVHKAPTRRASCQSFRLFIRSCHDPRVVEAAYAPDENLTARGTGCVAMTQAAAELAATNRRSRGIVGAGRSIAPVVRA